MLPMINVNPQNNDGDIKKQLSSLRTQMATLRDAIEADLSNIRYDNLSPDLQKRIDEIDKTATSSSESISMVAQSLAVNYASIKDLSAVTARVGTIEANYITASEVSANYASFGWVQALDAIVGTINADYIKTNQLNAVDAKFSNLNASNIKSGTLNAARIDVDTLVGDSLKGKTIYCAGIVASSYVTLLGKRCYWEGGKLCTDD